MRKKDLPPSPIPDIRIHWSVDMTWTLLSEIEKDETRLVFYSGIKEIDIPVRDLLLKGDRRQNYQILPAIEFYVYQGHPISILVVPAYIDPIGLPLDLETVALTFEDSKYYSTSGLTAWSEWNLLNHFPEGHGFVRLGPNYSLFRLALIDGPNDHSGHCLNFLRQAILCNSDTTSLHQWIDGRLKRLVYAYIEENQRGPVWAEHKTEM
ncbi:hypothetical protein F4604DRAFT_1906394 [Suillus subluteus]|nr:hypothetical protein F4604DRAFT_1906394 [Suillus subluteus]